MFVIVISQISVSIFGISNPSFILHKIKVTIIICVKYSHCGIIGFIRCKCNDLFLCDRIFVIKNNVYTSKKFELLVLRLVCERRYFMDMKCLRSSEESFSIE